ncbi:MAG: hypothetical protein ACUVV3_08285 [Dehalococcoidia bacterium]
MPRSVGLALATLLMVLASACQADGELQPAASPTAAPTVVAEQPSTTPQPGRPSTTEPATTPQGVAAQEEPPGDSTFYWQWAFFREEFEVASPEVQAAIEKACSDIDLLWRPVHEALPKVQGLWEYGKLAALANLAHLWWITACVEKANLGLPFLPLPPQSLMEALRADSYGTPECEGIATELEAQYLRIARERMARLALQEVIELTIAPLEQRWHTECEPD